MFTGIIEAIGTVSRLEPVGGDMRFVIDTGELDMGDVSLGDSIAVNGVCLTAIAFDSHSFSADVSNETLSLTSLKQLKSGSPVNLEKALLPTTRLGGHLVSGHVDGLGRVISKREDARSIRIEIEVPKALVKYIAVKGSICIDGTSLTVNSVEGTTVGLNIVPHTQERTVIRHYRDGQDVNIEVDLIARYLESLLLGTQTGGGNRIDMQMLRDNGFA